MGSRWLVLMLLASASALAAGPVVTTCETKNPREVNLIRITTADARQILARKTEIALPGSISSKFAASVVTLEVDINRQGELECFTLFSDRAEEKFTADDKEDLRSAMSTGLNFWVFQPYMLNGKPAEVRATYRLQVEPKRLVLERSPILKPKF